MAMTNVEQAVLNKAQQEAEAVLDEARGATEAHWERASARLRESHERRVEALRAELTGTLERQCASRETEDRLERLKIKNEIIDKVFRRAAEGIVSLPDDGYHHWLKSQLSHLPERSGGRVAANERDREIVGRLLKEIPDPQGLALSEEPLDILGGFLVQGERADLDYSVDSLLSVLRESLAEEVAASLFRGEAE